MRHCHQSVPYASELSETVDMNQDQNAQRILRSWRESKNLLIMASDQDKVLRIIQANLGREIIASNELLQDATTRGAALLLVQEPYASDGQVCGLGKYANNIITGNEKGEIPAAGIVVLDKDITAVKLAHLRTSHCVCAHIKTRWSELYVITMYCQFSDEIEPYMDILTTALRSMGTHEVIIAADANAPRWSWIPGGTSQSVAQQRGEAVEGLAAGFELVFANDKNELPTFRRGNTSIDVTMMSPSLQGKLKKWNVLDECTSSYHRAILVELSSDPGVEAGSLARKRRYNTRKPNWTRFSEALGQSADVPLPDAISKEQVDEQSGQGRNKSEILQADRSAISHKQTPREDDEQQLERSIPRPTACVGQAIWLSRGTQHNSTHSRGNTTENIVLAIMFDVTGAFDHLRWELLEELKRRDCPSDLLLLVGSYLSDRRVSVQGVSDTITHKLSKGCPQGFILGPSFWNLCADELLRTIEQAGGLGYMYADDLIILVMARSRREVERKAQPLVDTISNWFTKRELQISKSKTEMVILKDNATGNKRGTKKRILKQTTGSVTGSLVKTGRSGKRPPTIKLSGTSIKYSSSVKYLGVTIATRCMIGEHIEKTGTKARLLFEKLSIICRARWGMTLSNVMTLYRGVFVPIIAYATEAWCPLASETILKDMQKYQRTPLLRACRAYVTTPTEALQVMCGVLPLDLEIKRRFLIGKVKRGESFVIGDTNIEANQNHKNAIARVEEALTEIWQRRWGSSEKGRTTFEYYPDLTRNKSSQEHKTEEESSQEHSIFTRKEAKSVLKTAANVLATNNQVKASKVFKNRHVLRITAQDAEIPLEELQKKLRDAVNPSKEKIHIRNCRPTKSGAIMIETNTVDDMTRLMSSTKISEAGLRVQKQVDWLPKMIIYDVPTELTETSLKAALTEQNEELSEPEIRFEPKFRLGPKDTSVVHWVIELSPEFRNKVTKMKGLFLGWQRCRIKDYRRLSRCYKCQDVGHIAKFCPAQNQTCGKCTQEGHTMKDCTSAERVKRCVLCARAKRPAEHFMDDKCPMYRQALKRIDAFTDYGE
ncbi:unnamed protein product [Trichogramma brassicae]|uniref:CCHC-type domain-containing protein n=1 Tax=Trichogramma brassicae TaxID=86971 RepID=A0A6H5J0R1_9HYME|nr:unnamed protein product [Trichogramma brassicae]